MPTGYIQGVQTITGHIMQTGMKGNIKDSDRISGIVSQTQRLTGTVKNPSHVHGIISKPSYEHGKSDHVFVIVDLLKLYAANTEISNVSSVVLFTVQTSQVLSKMIEIYAVPTTVTVNSITANTSFTATNITVNEEICTNANE